ncbi:hypothetical protein BG011_001388 [Mortierella polycephala]|uniref:RING-CH-type domain-containing protein n=1 Tax=Mortierella polycephala TaxID=41804 RepID=A0A9P6PLF6_9FUNG|nr:hypothetical protein BG011_001388 [Mortierella polycephala]
MSETNSPSPSSSAPTTTATKAVDDRDTEHDHDDYDRLVDEDWLDMDSAPQQSALTVDNDVHQVPSLSRAPGHQTQLPSSTDSLHSDAVNSVDPVAIQSTSTPANLTTSTSSSTTTAATTAPVSLTASTDDGQVLLPGSSSPSSTSSSVESEYSLLNPSLSSRKNSMSSVTGLPALTLTDSHTSIPSPATTSSSHQSRNQEYLQSDATASAAGITSPSFSDFVQVGSDHDEDFSGIESALVSAQSSNADNPSRTSSEGKGQVETNIHDVDTGLSGRQSQVDPQELHVGELHSDRSRNLPQSAIGQVSSSFDIPVAAPAVMPEAAPVAAAAQNAMPVKRTLYRTTVEDARGSSEEEHESFRSAASGIRYRGPNAPGNNHEDVRKSFFGSFASASDMPGALNLGLDAELPSTTGAASSAAATATATNDPSMEERQCRICLGGADEEDTLGRLISPCLCKGSMKYVHVECLNAWRARSPKRESHYKCDTCKYAFSFRRTSFAHYLAHPLTLFALTLIVFAVAVFAAGFAMKLILYLIMDEPTEFLYPIDIDEFDEAELEQLRKDMVIFKTPDSLRAVFRIDKTHMVFGSFFVSIVGFLQLFVTTFWMGGGGGIFRIGGFGLNGGRRRGGRGERQGEAGIGGMLLVMILVFGLFKSVYMTYQFVNRASRRVLAKAEMMVLEVQ